MAKRKFEPSFENLPIDEIIGAPLRATASANAMMAREQFQFLMDFCFRKNDNKGYEPVMVEMIMTRSQMVPSEDDDSMELKQYSTRFSLPLLTLIPISSLAVDSFDLDFDMEITSLETQNRKNTLSETGEEERKEFKLMGKVSNKSEALQSRNSQYQKKIDSKLSINIKAKPLPLPVGVTSILQLYSSNIAPVEFPKSEDNNDKYVPES